MKKVTITTETVNAIAYEEIIRTHEKKAKRAIIKERTAELVSQGIDKELAKVMAECGL